MPPLNEESPPPVIQPIPAGAGFGIRLAARVIDLAYGMILSVIVGVFVGVFLAVLEGLGKIDEGWIEAIEAEYATDYLMGALALILYHTFAEGIGSTSLGKLMLRLRVVHENGRPCTLMGAAKRDVAYIMDSLFFGLVGYTSMQKSRFQQRYGDKWAKTVVVKKSEFTPVPEVSTGRILAGLCVGSFAWMGVALIDMLTKVF